MAPQAAARFLSGRPSGTQPTTDEQARLERARAAVAARPEGVAQDGMVAPLPAELNQHVAQLRELAGHLFDLGWQPAMVDLSRVCAFQRLVRVVMIMRVWKLSFRFFERFGIARVDFGTLFK